ncbi:hypothetical protein Tco_0577500 [Tanacetum coccineum]
MVIKSNSEEDMLKDIQETFDRSQSINMKINPKKYSFGAEEGLFLGHLIIKQGIRANPSKVKSFTNLEPPRILKDIQSLNGKLAALNSFLSKVAEKSLPLFRALKSCTDRKTIQWIADAEKAFQKMKKFMENLATLTAPLKGEMLIMYLAALTESISDTYKQLYDLIKPTHIRSKGQCDALIDQVNKKSVEISDLNASLQEKGLVITALKNDLRKLKGKALVDNDVTKHTIDPDTLKIDMEPIASKLLNNRTTHSDYLKHTQEQAAILKEVVKQGKSQNPLNNSLDSDCKYTKRIQEPLIIIRQTCPSINNSGDKLVAVTPKNKDKRVRFTKPVTSSGNKITKTDSSSNLVSNRPVLSSTREKPSTSASGSQPSGNTKKHKIQQPPSSTQKNKV